MVDRMLSAQNGATAQMFTIITAISEVLEFPRKSTGIPRIWVFIRNWVMWPNMGLYIRRQIMQETAAGMA